LHRISQEHRKEIHVKKKQFERTILELKTAQKKAMLKMAKSNRQALNRAQRAVHERARQDRILFEQEYARLRHTYQVSLAQLKDLHVHQNTIALNDLKESITSVVNENKKEMSQVAHDSQAQFVAFQTWLQEELPRHLIEGANIQSESDSDMDSLIGELRSKDQMIEQAQERIARLEAALLAKQGRAIWNRMKRSSPPEPYKGEEPADPQQEVLNMIREIAQERSQMEASRKMPVQMPLPEFTDSFGSRMSKKMIH
jgi:hypothetical protein